MISINWRLPEDLFAGVNSLLASLPAVQHAEIKIEKPIEELLEGIDLGGFTMQVREITSDDLRSLTASLAEGEALSVNGRSVAIYIEDKTGMLPTDDVEILPKVHIVNCGMSDKNPGRYVMVVNPDGMFGVVFSSGRAGRRLVGRTRQQKMLRVCERCKKCLKSQKSGLVGKFNLTGSFGPWSKQEWAAWNRFISSHHTAAGIRPHTPPLASPRPSDHAQAGTLPTERMGYTADWQKVSSRRREAAKWTCCDCGVRCESGQLRSLLDVHHVNRNKQDNTDINLLVLCRLCHREQGFKSPHDDHELLVVGNPGQWKAACREIQMARLLQGIAREIPPAFKI